MAFNPSTNRLVAVPHRDVKIPEFAEGRRIDDAGQKILRSGGSIPLEGCTAYGDTENTYKGILNYDVYRGRYTISDPVYDKPYVPKYLRDQLSDADVKTLLAGGQVSADQVKDSFGGADEEQGSVRESARQPYLQPLSVASGAQRGGRSIPSGLAGGR